MSHASETYNPASVGRVLKALKINEQAIVFAGSANAVSAEFARTEGEYLQQEHLLVSPKTLVCQRVWLVTRTG